MPTTLARAKAPGPKEKLELRDYDWKRCWIIYSLAKRPDHAALWWARRFLKRVVADPLVHRGRSVVDEGPSARVMLNEFDAKYGPEPNYKKKRAKRGVKKKVKKKPKQTPARISVTKNLLRGVTKKLKEIEPKALFWERKLAKMVVSDKKLPDTMHKVKELRTEIKRLNERKLVLKERLK